MMTTIMAFLGGIPTLISIGVFIFAVVILGKKKMFSVRGIRAARAHADNANANYKEIKERIQRAPILVRWRFRLLVGSKRWNDYNYQG